MIQENGLMNHWFRQRLFIIKVKNNHKAHKNLSNVMNCMMDVFKIEREIQLKIIQFFKVTLTGLKILFYIILGGFELSIVILLGEITIFILAKLY